MAGPPLTLSLVRAFWWNPAASSGTPGHPEYIPPYQHAGRFDIPGVEPIRYLAESKAHAIAEVLQDFRGRIIRPAALVRFGGTSRLAAVDVVLDLPDADLLPDLCDPAVVLRSGVLAIDQLMSKQRPRSQELAKRIYERGLSGGPSQLAGFRVWSALNGDWHSVIVFAGRVAKLGSLTFGTPQLVPIDDPDLIAVAQPGLMNFKLLK